MITVSSSRAESISPSSWSISPGAARATASRARAARLAERHVTLELTDAAKDRLIRVGYDPAYGARPLKRVIQRAVQNPLALEVARPSASNPTTP